MGLVIHAEQVLHRELGISLRGRKALVAKHFLNRAEISPFFEHVRAEGMPQGVGMNIGRESFRHRDFLYDSTNAACCEPTTTLVDQERWRCLPSLRQHKLTLREIIRQPGLHRISEWNVAFLLSFATNQDRFGTDTNVIEVYSDQFRVANSTPVKQFEHEAISLRKAGHFRHVAVKYRIHFFQRWYTRQFLRQLRG